MIVEIAKGDRNKCEYDIELGVFRLDRAYIRRCIYPGDYVAPVFPAYAEVVWEECGGKPGENRGKPGTGKPGTARVFP